MGQGIAGYVFEHLEAVSIPDCYKDPRFDCSFDRASGYTTRSLLAAPILDYEGSCVGVLQAINKVGPHDKAVFDPMPIGMRAVPFRRNDEKMLLHLTQHVGIALRNSEVYREAISSSERATGLLNTIQGLSQDLGIQSMLLTITMHAGQIVSCERSTVFLLDEAKGELWSVSTDTGQEIRIPKTTGLAGECCSEGKLINIPDAYADSRFNQDVDKRTGFKTQSILAIPMLTAGGDVLGVIQMINKVSPDGAYEVFDEADVAVMELFAKFVGPRLTQSPALVPQAARRPPPSEAALALSPGARAPGPAPQPRRSGCRAEAMGPLQERTRSTRARWAAAERPTARRRGAPGGDGGPPHGGPRGSAAPQGHGAPRGSGALRGHGAPRAEPYTGQRGAPRGSRGTGPPRGSGAREEAGPLPVNARRGQTATPGPQCYWSQGKDLSPRGMRCSRVAGSRQLSARAGPGAFFFFASAA
ncbi:unnamed protein product [Prorocentrum cordatum]|uniref:GAF domain-containing protein n=1 Tax=Prorocentrum cordatum TaxID=2364126 RepID=A0ABN9TNC3_9DINO|nr:unnamed protein product [Polarella glacialis]